MHLAVGIQPACGKKGKVDSGKMKLCWSFREAGDIALSGPAEKMPWIRPAILAALCLREVGGL